MKLDILIFFWTGTWFTLHINNTYFYYRSQKSRFWSTTATSSNGKPPDSEETTESVKAPIPEPTELEVKLQEENVKLEADLKIFKVYNVFFYIFVCSVSLSLVLYKVMVFNTTFNNISVILCRLVLLVDETGENHRPVTSHWQTLSLNIAGLDINVCPIPVKTYVGQVDLVLRLSDGTSEKIRFPNVPVQRTNLFPLV
jgi:hypothetical protein